MPLYFHASLHFMAKLCSLRGGEPWRLLRGHKFHICGHLLQLWPSLFWNPMQPHPAVKFSLNAGFLQWLRCVERSRVEAVSSLNTANSPVIVQASPHRSAFAGSSRPEASAKHSSRYLKTGQLQRKRPFTTKDVKGILLWCWEGQSPSSLTNTWGTNGDNPGDTLGKKKGGWNKKIIFFIQFNNLQYWQFMTAQSRFLESILTYSERDQVDGIYYSAKMFPHLIHFD